MAGIELKVNAVVNMITSADGVAAIRQREAVALRCHDDQASNCTHGVCILIRQDDKR